MFNKSNNNKDMKHQSSAQNQIFSILGEGCHFVGDVFLSSDMRIGGVVEGRVVSSAKVTVEETGKVNGEISAENAEIFGIVEGNVNAREMIKVASHATIIGEITADRISVEDGARLEARIKKNQSHGRPEESKYA